MSDEHVGQPQVQPPMTEPDAVLDRLRTLLTRQLALVHRGRLAEAEALCEQTGPLVGTVAAVGVLAGSAGEDQRRSLLLLYRRICLALAAQRDEVANSLRTIHRGRRLLNTYGKRAP
jgi:hypothetical protein